MLANYHTHTTFCDGRNTPEEVVLAAIEKGFDAIGFSSHGYSPRYGLKDPTEYLAEIAGLKEKYKGKIQIYSGIEEDATSLMDRAGFDYLIGAMHYVYKNGEYYPIDSNPERFSLCLSLYGGDELAFAKDYYENYLKYIKSRKPDIVAHFDLITKFDEVGFSSFFMDERYMELSERYMEAAADTDVIFEVNTGAISRGFRTSPYPHERLLKVLKRRGGKVMLNSDSHAVETLDCGFREATELLYEVGFRERYVFYDGAFQKIPL